MKSCGCETYFSPTNNGPRLNRCCPSAPAKGDRGPMIGLCWKASFGYSERARVGRICPTNTPVPARAGGVCVCGRRMARGSKSGGSSWLSWTRKAAWTGVSRFWMAVSLRQKKGRLRRKNQEGQRHKVDGGGRRPRCSSGKQIGVGHPGGSNLGRGRLGEHFGPARRARTAAQTPVARGGRQSLRQRSAALALAATRHPLDQPAPRRTPETLAQRWARTAPLSQAVQSRTNLCLAGKLPKAARAL